MDVLSNVLRSVRLAGAVFFRANFTSPWALASPDGAGLAALVLPKARHLVMFHCIEAGTAWVEVAGTPRRQLESGDVVIFPFGDAHTMGQGRAPAVEGLERLFPGPPPGRLRPR